MESFNNLEPLYTAEQVRALDRAAIDGVGDNNEAVPGIQLMARAGRTCFRILLETWATPGALQVFCGSGNNGGDGFVIAALAKSRGMEVTVYQLGDPNKIKGDALTAREQAIGLGVEVLPFAADISLSSGVIVDALLGTGLGGDVRGPYLSAIELINRSELPVMAVDIPSGLCADTGVVLGDAVQADITVTLIGLKRGLLTAQAPDYTGAVVLNDLQVPAAVYQQVPATVHRLELPTCLAWLQPRRQTAHKGDFGRLLVVGGDLGMAGALVMAAEAAARSGAGLVRAATHPEHITAMVARCPEVMALPVSNGQQLSEPLGATDVVVIGPGLGKSPWSEQMLHQVRQAGLPTLLDADALNLLAAGDVVATQCDSNWVLTPHPAEAARLLGISVAQVQADRFSAVQEISRRYGGVTLLKGAGTLICDGNSTLLCDCGNPGMASGGMGDVLSGIIGGLMAQGLSGMRAASLGAVLHAVAADRAAGDGQRSVLATDLLPPLRKLLG